MKSDRKVKKAVIPAAGLGTRFLPATKAIPKEMLPIVDIPTIQYIVEEAVASGIEEILIITNSNKHCMENHFDKSYELEDRLKEAGKMKEVKMIDDIANLAKIYYVRQKEMCIRDRDKLTQDSKVFIQGRASVEEEKQGKVICEKIIPFDEVPRELWIKFSNIDNFVENEQKLYRFLRESDGTDSVIVYCKAERQIKRLAKSYTVAAEGELIVKLISEFGAENVKVVEKSIENIEKMN